MMERKFKQINKSTFDAKISHLKLQNILSLTPEDSLHDVIESITDKKMSSVIIAENEVLKGVITEVDFLHRVLGKVEDLKNEKVGNYMHKAHIYLGNGNTIKDCILLIAQHEFRHIIIVDEKKKPIHVVSAKDIINFVLSSFPEDLSGYKFAENWKVLEVQEIESFYEEDEEKEEFISAGLFFKAIRRVPSNTIVKVDINEKVNNVLKKLQESRKSTCVVMENSVDLVGVATDRDFVRKVLYKDLDINNMCIKDIMVMPKNILLQRHFFVNAVKAISNPDYRTTIIVNEEKYPLSYVTHLDMVKYIAQEIFNQRDGKTTEAIFS